MIVYLLKRNAPYKNLSIHAKINSKGIAIEEKILSHPSSRHLFRMIVLGCFIESNK